MLLDDSFLINFNTDQLHLFNLLFHSVTVSVASQFSNKERIHSLELFICVLNLWHQTRASRAFEALP